MQNRDKIEFNHGVSIVYVNSRPLIKDHNTFLSMETAFEHKVALEKAIIELNKLNQKEKE